MLTRQFIVAVNPISAGQWSLPGTLSADEGVATCFQWQVVFYNALWGRVRVGWSMCSYGPKYSAHTCRAGHPILPLVCPDNGLLAFCYLLCSKLRLQGSSQQSGTNVGVLYIAAAQQMEGY